MYQELCSKTESINDEQKERSADCIRLLHGAIGLCTECGEIQDTLKKHIYYGAILDKDNLVEELGDVLWYVALLCNALQVNMNNVMDRNIEKLKRRYGDKFSKDKALNRNVEFEQKVFKEET